MTDSTVSLSLRERVGVRVRPLTILYRGPLSSCNYGCEYCPFAKRHETNEEHAHDGAMLKRFSTAMADAGDVLSQAQRQAFVKQWTERYAKRGG